jgi:uncharacterized protein (TIGR03546 family)
MIFLKLFSKLIKLLRSAASPAQIAGGFVFGMMIGIISLNSLFTPIIILFIIILNVNVTSAILAALLFRLIAFLIDPFLHSLGYWVLVDVSALTRVWEFLYNIPIFPYTRFNNTVVMGGLILSVVILYPVFKGISVLIRNYREKYEERIKKWKIIKVLSGTKFFKFFGGLKNLGV